MPLRDHLTTIFEADRTARDAEVQLLSGGEPDALADLLGQAVDEALAGNDPEDAASRLTRLSDLCAQVDGPAMVDALIRILNYQEPAVRAAAGEALLDVGYERYAEVARAVERAVDSELSGPALQELPWVVREIAEPSAVTLIRKFLSSLDADAVAAAIEALASLGDPAALPALQKLIGDTREAVIDDFEEETSTTVGELAEEAVALLEEALPEEALPKDTVPEETGQGDGG